MRHLIYIQAVALVVALSMIGCSKSDYHLVEDDMLQVEGITLGMDDVDPSSIAATRADVLGVNYAVNSSYDPTRTRVNNTNKLLNGRDNWKLDFFLYNGNPVSKTKYEHASFEKGTYDTITGFWNPSANKPLYFPNYFNPRVEAWLYAEEKNAKIAADQSEKSVILAQDQLFRGKSSVPIGKIFVVDMLHQHAMIDFKFEGVAREDIDESSVRVRLEEAEYKPFKVKKAGTLEFMLILSETATSNEMYVEFNTKSNGIHQPIIYKQAITLNNGDVLGSNICYCFTMSGKAMEISPITIINWTSGEPVLGEYVAVTAYPTFKGPVNNTFYFYYDNQLTEDGTLGGTPVLQEIAFNGDGECTVKPHGRTITHIFKDDKPTKEDWESYKLVTPVVLGGNEKMYIDLEAIIGNLP